jgi:tRNA (cmo5U34)-methyltransferase
MTDLEKNYNIDRMNSVKKRFEDEADEYDTEFVKMIPHYNESIEALVNSIPFEETKAIKVLDLGCGTGTVTKYIKDIYENATITALDLSPKMIGIAKKKLREYKKIDFLVGDFFVFDFKKGYDVVVSSLAIHHIDAKGKKTLYQRIHDILNDGGVFYNNDRIIGANEDIERLNNLQFLENLKNHYDEEKIKEIYESADENDSPSQLFEQLKWLEEIGFKNIDVVWKYYGQGVYGGVKKY